KFSGDCLIDKIFQPNNIDNNQSLSAQRGRKEVRGWYCLSTKMRKKAALRKAVLLSLKKGLSLVTMKSRIFADYVHFVIR
ncbi:MAG: hypothetical protein JW894_00005, partial [Bacteroidales bacterium]|nr:hypothetical protein [Bacteroidales bacterium]